MRHVPSDQFNLLMSRGKNSILIATCFLSVLLKEKQVESLWWLRRANCTLPHSAVIRVLPFFLSFSLSLSLSSIFPFPPTQGQSNIPALAVYYSRCHGLYSLFSALNTAELCVPVLISILLISSLRLTFSGNTVIYRYRSPNYKMTFCAGRQSQSTNQCTRQT